MITLIVSTGVEAESNKEQVKTTMKQQRHAVIQELLVKTAVASQDELRRKLAGRGFEIRQAMNLLVLVTTTGSAQPIAAGIDYEDWSEVVGTIAGDDTVLIICPDEKQANLLKTRIEGYLG